MRLLFRSWLLIGFGILGLIPLRAEAKPPNIVMIISDDQAWTDFGFMGHETIRTPHLDRLASQSAVFPRGYVPNSLCRPSLATMITGLYPHQHKISGNDPAPPPEVPRRSLRRDPDYLRECERLIAHIEDVPTLPRLLAEKGYVSHQSGKWWEGHFSRGGFDAGMTHGDPSRGGRHGDEGLKIGRQGMQPIFDFIADAGDKPFFLWYAPFLPHSPHNPPQRLLDKYRAANRPIELARYYAMCEWFDETCGELLNHLDDQGLADETLVLFVTDNGWIQRTPETKLPPDWSFGFAPKSKRSPYDGGLRTPIMVRWPGHVEPGRRDDLASSIDLVPTALAAAGIDPPQSLPGLNLFDLAKENGQGKRNALYGEIFSHDIADIDRPAASLEFRWIIQDDWKLIVPAANGPVELYNLKNDPHETHNVAEKSGDVVNRLRQKLDAWWSPKAADR